MKDLQRRYLDRGKRSHDSPASDLSGLMKTGFFSLLLHAVLIVLLILNTMSAFSRGSHSVYRITLRPFSPPGDGNPPGASGPGLPGAPGASSAPAIAEKPKPDEASKKSNTIESAKIERKKIERVEKGEVSPSAKKQQPKEDKFVEGLKKSDKKVEKGEGEKGSGKSLQDAIEEIHKKVALEEIQKRVARRGGEEKRVAGGPSSSQAPIFSSSKGLSAGGPGSGSGTGTGSGRGTGTGTGAGTGSGSGGSPWGSSGLESKLNDYYSLIWAKIKEAWTLPENLPKEKTDLEAVIVVVIEREGKVQKSWFEKRSGNALYDQMAMRAIKKAEPFPPIPKEFSDNTFEIGIRFHPD